MSENHELQPQRYRFMVEPLRVQPMSKEYSAFVDERYLQWVWSRLTELSDEEWQRVRDRENSRRSES